MWLCKTLTASLEDMMRVLLAASELREIFFIMRDSVTLGCYVCHGQHQYRCYDHDGGRYSATDKNLYAIRFISQSSKPNR